jgi:hydrogenase maturation protease
MKVLIAGVGNLLRGDDGFGMRALQQLEAEPSNANVKLLEVGTSGLSLIQELMAGYDACVILDAVDRSAAPGSIFVLEPQPELLPANLESLHSELVDMHYAEPSRALLLAQALGVRPPQVYVVACQPAETEEMSEMLSPSVKRAVRIAVEKTKALLEELFAVPATE